jgi:hypothetical protein
MMKTILVVLAALMTLNFVLGVFTAISDQNKFEELSRKFDELKKQLSGD